MPAVFEILDDELAARLERLEFVIGADAVANHLAVILPMLADTLDVLEEMFVSGCLDDPPVQYYGVVLDC